MGDTYGGAEVVLKYYVLEKHNTSLRRGIVVAFDGRPSFRIQEARTPGLWAPCVAWKNGFRLPAGGRCTRFRRCSFGGCCGWSSTSGERPGILWRRTRRCGARRHVGSVIRTGGTDLVFPASTPWLATPVRTRPSAYLWLRHEREADSSATGYTNSLRARGRTAGPPAERGGDRHPPPYGRQPQPGRGRQKHREYVVGKDIQSPDTPRAVRSSRGGDRDDGKPLARRRRARRLWHGFFEGGDPPRGSAPRRPMNRLRACRPLSVHGPSMVLIRRRPVDPGGEVGHGRGAGRAELVDDEGGGDRG